MRMKKILLLMLTLLLSVVAFAQKPATGQLAEVYPGPQSIPADMVSASFDNAKETSTTPWRKRRAFSGDVITEQPEGTLKTYIRSGSYVNSSGNIRSQTGFAYIVFAEDGTTVWFKDLVSGYGFGSWVQGTIDGNKITVPLGQPITFLNPTYGNAVLGITFPSASVKVSGDLTFTMTEKTITLDTYTHYSVGIVGGCFEYNSTVYGLQNLNKNYGDYATSFTLFEEPEVVTPPDGISTADMPLTASENGSTDYSATVKVGWVGNDVYIQGLNKYLPDAWVKGTLNDEGTQVTFPIQYMGKDAERPYYLTGYSSGSVATVKMDYDADTKTFTGNGSIMINGSATAMSYVVFYNGMIIGTPPSPIVVPDGLETKSYAMGGQYTEDGETAVDIAEDHVVKIGVADGVYYIQGLLPNVPEGWVQGTLADGKLTIPAGLYLGKDTRYGIGQYIVAGSGNVIEDIVLDYDATNDKFTSTAIIYTSRKKNSINWYIAIYSGAVIGTRSAVNVAEGIENGTVTVDKPKAFTGDVVTVTATPADGCELEAIIVKGADETEITVTDGKFTMPAQAVTVSATFKSTTGISVVKVDDQKNSIIYNLQGQRVEKAQAKGGVFIVNGKKVVIK